MGIDIAAMLEGASQDDEALCALADSLFVLNAFAKLPTPQLAEGVADGSFAESVLALVGALPLCEADALAIQQICAAMPSGDAPDLGILRCDYTRLHAHPKRPLALPCEASFKAAARGEEAPLVAVNSCARSLDKTYAAHGVSTVRETTVPADHIAVETAYLATLVERCIADPGHGSTDVVAFVEEHVKCWWGEFYKAVRTHAQTDAYRLVGAFGAALFG